MDKRRLPCSDCRKRQRCIANRDPNDGTTLSGFRAASAMSRASSTTRVFRSAEKAHPTIRRDQASRTTARSGSGQRRQEGDVGHPQLVRPLGHEVAADEIAGGMMACRLPRRDRRASAPADARDPCRPHQPSNPLPPGQQRGHRPSAWAVNTRRAIGSMRSSVDRADMTRQIGVGGRDG